MRRRRIVQYALVFASGAATMAVEMCASRLLAPYFGNSLPVWGVVIGMLLAYLSLGYFLGGRLADRYPMESLSCSIAAWAGFVIGLIPYLARPILRYSASGFAQYQAGPVLGSLLGILILFAVPVVLLGCVSPFAIRLSIETAASAGRTAGHVYALSTVGSLLGTFASVFWLIPSFGTRSSMSTISVWLLGTAVLGLLVIGRRRALLPILLLATILALQLLPLGAIKPTAGMIYEADSAYNYIQVLREGEEIVLKLNEGEGIQSSYSPGQVLSGYVYDYFLLAPFFRAGEYPLPVTSMCLVGLAGGTAARQYSVVFGDVPIDGIEIDPGIVEVGRRFFGLDLPNLQIAVADGRYHLAHSTKRYDIILVDAYHPPYIPFQLTTIEFFLDVQAHLTPDGVVAINVARTETDYSLVTAIASTLKAVFPSVYIMDPLSNLNSIAIASRQPTQLLAVTARLSALSDHTLTNVAQRAEGRISEFTQSDQIILTDDRAPVEQIVHAIMARYLLGRPAEEVQQ
jgi:spermidine synthase